MSEIRGRRYQVLGIVVLVSVVAVACQSQDRRTLNDAVDQEEDNAREQVALYEDFEAELLAELRNDYGADAESGCPELQTLPAIRGRDSGLGISWNRQAVRELDEEEDRRLETENAARTRVWVDNIPAEHCTCIQQTLRSVRTSRERIDLTRFDVQREEVAKLSDEALAQRMAFMGVPEPGFSPDDARNRIEAWTTRRYEDWRGRSDRWDEDETKHGWEDYRYEARAGIRSLFESNEPLLTRLRWNYTPVGCSMF